MPSILKKPNESAKIAKKKPYLYHHQISIIPFLIIFYIQNDTLQKNSPIIHPQSNPPVTF